jgi:hypothetical protein
MVLDALRFRGGRLLSRIAPRTAEPARSTPAAPLAWKTQAMDATVDLEDEEALARARQDR